MVDIPYDKADQMIKKLGGKRTDLSYKVIAFGLLLYMIPQILFTIFSIFLANLGLKPLYRGSVVNRFKNSDLVISHSDENFKEFASILTPNPIWVITWWSMLISRTCDIMVAKSLRKPVVMFPNSVGPFRTWMGRFLGKLSLNNCDYVLIRETISFKIVKDLGIHASRILTYDTALLYEAKNKSETKDFVRPTLGISAGIYNRSISEREVENYIQSHALALDEAIEKHGFFVVFLPHYVSGLPYDDLEVSGRIFEKMKNKERAEIVNTDGVEEFKLYLDKMDMIISSKMHPAILGASGFVPLLCILYDHKQTSFFERLNMINCTIGIRELSGEQLSGRIDYVWNHGDFLSKSLQEQIPKWQNNVRTAIQSTVTHYF